MIWLPPKPTNQELDEINLTSIFENMRAKDQGYYLFAPSGQEHYRLLAWLGFQFEEKVFFEFGTWLGTSSLALALNSKNEICTYDVAMQPPNKMPYFTDNIKESLIGEIIPKLDCDLIFYDTEHDGRRERYFIEQVKAQGWIGPIIFDDIYYNGNMIDFWKKLPYKKECWTDVGHWTGTGVVYIE